MESVSESLSYAQTIYYYYYDPGQQETQQYKYS